MTVYTHDTAMRPDCTNIRMIVSDATAQEIGLDAAWIAIDAEEVADTEELTGQPYPQIEGWDKIVVAYTATGARVEKWGRL